MFNYLTKMTSNRLRYIDGQYEICYVGVLAYDIHIITERADVVFICLSFHYCFSRGKVTHLILHLTMLDGFDFYIKFRGECKIWCCFAKCGGISLCIYITTRSSSCYFCITSQRILPMWLLTFHNHYYYFSTLFK